MPADVIADLEAYCGEKIYSTALFEAGPAHGEARDLRDEVCEAVEAVAALQREVRLATRDGRITHSERDLLRRSHAQAENELRDVGELLSRET